MYIRATKHFQYGLLDPQRKEKENKTIYTGKLPTSKKKNKKSFWVFILIKLTIFCFFLRFIKHTRRRLEKEIYTSMDNTMKEYEHRRLE